jgi:hypothetical protein
MKKIVLIVCLGCCYFNVSAQFGVNATYNLNNAPLWTIKDLSNNNTTTLPGSGLGVGIDYWVPLKGARIELLPELNFAKYDANAVDLGALHSEFYSFFLKANLYLLDFKGDCHCPTFSKSGKAVSKGFYLQVAPGISYLKSNIAMLNGVRLYARTLVPSISLSGGLDIGISDLLTITPFGGVRIFPSANWQGLEESLRLDPSLGSRSVKNVSNLTQIFAGVRLGFRLDKRR